MLNNKQIIIQKAPTEATDWIRSHTGPDEIFLVMPDSPSVNLIMYRGDRLLVYGYTIHNLSTATADELKKIRDEIKTIYCTPDRETFYRLCEKYKINYINIGKYEESVIENCPDRYKWDRESNLVFQNISVKIYRIDPSQDRPI